MEHLGCIVGSITLAGAGALAYLAFPWKDTTLSPMQPCPPEDTIDPTEKEKLEARKQVEEVLRRIGAENVELSDHEMIVAAHLLDPCSMYTTRRDINSHDKVITALKRRVVLPFQKKHLIEGCSLLKPRKGVLLSGPPGCGKTLIAKAMATDTGFRFIDLQPSALTDKWYSETGKMATAVFTLAVKLQPCIIFINDAESFLREYVKFVFMSVWDQLDSWNDDHQVIVMVATNRPRDIDADILRRMDSRLYIKLPGWKLLTLPLSVL